jgi:adenine-specific DNA methylase
MNDKPRLIERAFCLKQASLDSVHEKNVRHGHISTLHIWPARRPLAASRAALVATLLPDPETKEERDRVLDKLGGRLVRTVKKKKLPGGRLDEKEVQETLGGILHWGRESSPELQWFRDEIRKAYGGRAPRVLDPFAGGGAIPLEAMRLGCDVTACDINPVAWFILKCTLEYPQRLAGQHRPLPAFAAKSPEFMAGFFKATGKATKKQIARNLDAVQLGLFPPPDVDLAWHVRAWGWWVLERAKADLARFYPTIGNRQTVAYLWARTVTCKGCRATIPLLKTRWLAKSDDKRVVLTMRPTADRSGVEFGIENDVPKVGGNNAQRREHDRKIGAGTMSRSGAQCPCCPVIMTMEDIRIEGQAGRLGAVMTAVVVDASKGKDYRLPRPEEVEAARAAEDELGRVFGDVPFGRPDEPTPKGGSGASRAFSVDGYGFDRWSKLFTPRQLVALGTFVKHTRAAKVAMEEAGYPPEHVEAIGAYLAIAVDRIADASSTIAHWQPGSEFNVATFQRFALPISWDFSEVNVLAGLTGSYQGALDWIALVVQHLLNARLPERPLVLRRSVLDDVEPESVDVVVTDPPYYDAIPYSDLMDFFYIWLRRCVGDGLLPLSSEFTQPLGPKWDHSARNGELIDDSARFGGDAVASKKNYEDGMAGAFRSCHRALRPGGRLVIVFAHKQPDAWETLVSAIIRAGFVVDGSWPIQTERQARTRSLASAALSSSVWLVCKKRPEDARPGWDNRVLDEMRQNIYTRLREFWDAGIHGPDFVWAATGPALEAYSKHPIVKKANDPGQMMSVSEFLREVRRIVVEFAVGRVLSQDGEESAGGLDDTTIYYLLHRNDFGFDDAPAGAAILYAQACGLTDGDLVDRDILVRVGGSSRNDEEDEEQAEDGESTEDAREGTGSALRLRRFGDRRSRALGVEVDGRVPPLVDQLHKLMHLWRAGDVNKVNDYIDVRGLRRHPRFRQLVQSVIEMARKQGESDECSLLESISNHIAARGTAPTPQPTLPGLNVRPIER